MVIHTATGPASNFRAVWWAQAGIALACTAAVLAFFRPRAQALPG